MKNHRTALPLRTHADPPDQHHLRRASRMGLLAFTVLCPSPGRAETHYVTIRNGADETIRGIAMAMSGTGRVGENRLASRYLPPGATARIAYSQGCMADVQVSYASGQIEKHPGVEVCSDPRIVTGNGVALPSRAAKAAATAKTVTPAPNKAPLPAVPPWTGRSITKHFGGMY